MIRLTNSEMSTWRNCPRAWYLAYYRGLRRRQFDVAGRPTTLGTRVHDALAAYYDPETPYDPVQHVLAGIERECESYPTQEADIRKEGEMASIMVEGYVQWLEETAEDDDLRVLAAESKIEVPLFEGCTLLSKIDARVERISTGARLALEHKTCGSLTQALPLLQADTQCLTEHLVEFLDLKAKGLETERAQGVLYNMLRKVKRTARAKPPFYGRETVMHNVNELRSHWYHCVAIGRQIENARVRLDAGESHHTVCPPNPSRELLWRSEFFKDGMYELMDDGSDWEAAVDALYEVCDPLERYWGVTEYEEA
jgi:hypothetical protein